MKIVFSGEVYADASPDWQLCTAIIFVKSAFFQTTTGFAAMMEWVCEYVLAL